jgi:hypothetical protein
MARDSVLIDIDERNAELARERIGMFLEVIEANEPHSPAGPVASRTPGGAHSSV